MSRPATPVRGARKTGAASNEGSAQVIELGAAQTGKSQVMRVLADLREGDHRVTRWAASWRSTCVRRVLPAVEETAEHTKLWWGAAAALSATGWRDAGPRPPAWRAWPWRNWPRTVSSSRCDIDVGRRRGGVQCRGGSGVAVGGHGVCGASRHGGRRTRAHGRPLPLRRCYRCRDRSGRRLGTSCSPPGTATAAVTSTSHSIAAGPLDGGPASGYPGLGQAGVPRSPAQADAFIQDTSTTGS